MSSQNTTMSQKIAIMGDGGSGKTATTIQYVASHFVEYYDPTIEDSYRKQIVIEGCSPSPSKKGKKGKAASDEKSSLSVLIEILDTAGQEEFSPLRDQWIRESEAFVLIYSITSRASLEYLEQVLQQIMRTKECSPDFYDHPVPIVLAGNKCDLEDQREVSTEEAQQWARDHGVEMAVEISAKTRHNLTETFESLVRTVANKRGALGNTKSKKKREQNCRLL